MIIHGIHFCEECSGECMLFRRKKRNRSEIQVRDGGGEAMGGCNAVEAALGVI